MNSYKVITDQAFWAKWYDSTFATARAQGMAECFDRNYIPPPHLQNYFRGMLNTFYGILQKIIQTTEGKVIVKYHQYDANAQIVMAKLCDIARHSTHALLSSATRYTLMSIGDPQDG